MSTCTEDAETQLHRMQDDLSPIEETPVSPSSSSQQHQQTERDQVLLATMQPVNVIDLQPKYHHHNHHHTKYNNHNHHHHHHQKDEQVDSPPEHKMIDLIYNDGVKTVMYTHDKEIIYENEADRVQVVEYPPPPPSPPSVPVNCVNRQPTTVLVLSELVTNSNQHLAIPLETTIRSLSNGNIVSEQPDTHQGDQSGTGSSSSSSSTVVVTAGTQVSEDEDRKDKSLSEEDEDKGTGGNQGSTGGAGGAGGGGKRVAAVQVQVGGMEADWRTYCEHPLSVATTAMLNLQQQQQQQQQQHQMHQEPDSQSQASYVYEYYAAKLPDKTLVEHVKLPPTHELWSAGVMGQKLLVQEAGPESNPGGELHHFLHQYSGNQQQQQTPSTQQQHLTSTTNVSSVGGVKREPEDLTQPAKRLKHQSPSPPPPPPPGMYHHQHHQSHHHQQQQHQQQQQQLQYGSPYDPYSACSPRLQSQETAVYVTSDGLPRYDVVPNAGTYIRSGSAGSTSKVLHVDLPSPDSGIGADAVTPRQEHHAPTTLHQSSFDYTELCSGGNGNGNAVILESGSVLHQQPLQLQLQGQQNQLNNSQNSNRVSSGSTTPNSQTNPARSRPWHDFGRQNDADKIQIPKLYSTFGFKYHLESPISTSQRREDDRITYINKGQFYGITLDYVPDPDKPLLKPSQTVKSVVMLMFREEKSPEDEIKAWQFWHSRQHSVKQRILDADTKNSVGLVGCIEEIAHNAIAVYWNPGETSAKINVAVQCLSTDFSSQKGVKGLPLHIQIDTYEDPGSSHGPPSHRAYCQIKVFCDKGAERKTRDEERRAAKRKMTATGRKKLDELYHSVQERSEFYAMADLHKPPVLFTPQDPLGSSGQTSALELGGFYGAAAAAAAAAAGTETDSSSMSNGEIPKRPGLPALKFHNHFPPDSHQGAFHHHHHQQQQQQHEKKDLLLQQVHELQSSAPLLSAPGNRLHAPAQEDRVMLYVRQEAEDVYTPLHVVPPTVQGLLNAIESKYKIASSSINNLYRKNTKGITAKIDDDMVRYYVDEDLFLLEVSHSRMSPDHQDRRNPSSPNDPNDPNDLTNGGYDVTIIELPHSPMPITASPHHSQVNHVHSNHVHDATAA